jgi:hypothetical protein
MMIGIGQCGFHDGNGVTHTVTMRMAVRLSQRNEFICNRFFKTAWTVCVTKLF